MEIWIRLAGWVILILGSLIGLWISANLGMTENGSLSSVDLDGDHPLSLIYGIGTILLSLFAGFLLIGVAALIDFARTEQIDRKYSV